LPKTVSLSYASSQCARQFILFPGLFSVNNPVYSIEKTGGFGLFGRKIVSTHLCISPRLAPPSSSQETLALKIFGLLPIKAIHVDLPTYPRVDTDKLKTGIAPAKDLHLPIDTRDTFFSYALQVNNKTIQCKNELTRLSCPIPMLSLPPGSSFKMMLQRSVEEHYVDTVYQGTVKTLDPLNIIGGNAAQGSTIYDQPKLLELTFDKPLKSIEHLALYINRDNNDVLITTKYSIDNNRLLFEPLEPLHRKSHYMLRVDQAESTSGNMLIEAYRSEFIVSGGPTVTSHNTGTVAFDTTKNIIINFDQPIDSKDLASKVTISGKGMPSYSLAVRGGSLTVSPRQSLPLCAQITVQLTSTIKNEYGIDGDSSWSHSFKTMCHKSIIIGKSVQGRSIVAQWFGSGSKMTLFVAGIHGNEKSSVYTMESWLNELEAHADKIPSGHSIVIITKANPDGFSSNSRYNAHGVDLNRNFPTANWSPDVAVPGYPIKYGAGGTSALSEPESAAIASFIERYNPTMVLTYHAQANLISPNYAGNSVPAASLYASRTSYRLTNSQETDEALGYTTTGDLEFWARDRGTANIIVELRTLTGNEFSKNRDALWAMINL